MIDAKGIAWTHVFRWWDDEYGKAEAEVDCYVTDSYDVSLSNILLHCDAWDEDHLEVLEIIPNNFSYDDYLSDDVVYALKGDTPLLFIYENEEKGRMNVARWYVAYIGELYDRFFWNKEKREDYKNSVLKSVLKCMDLRRQNPVTIDVIDWILFYFNIQRNYNLNVRKQIKLILEPKENDYILLELAKTSFEKTLRRHLDKIGEAYRIHEEKSQYRIGVLFLKFYDTQRKLLSPSFIKPNSNKEIKNYSKYMKLMASYYGIDTPTYREGILRKYKEQGMKSSLISTIRNEHMDVWLSIE